MSQQAFPALPPTANICHFHTQGKELHTCKHAHSMCIHANTHTHTHTHLFLINTQTPPPYLYTHRDTQKLCSFPLASSSPCLYFNLQKKSSPKSQRGIQELRLQRHTLACTHTHMNTQSHRDTQQDGAEWATRQVWRLARISISN